MSDRPLIIVGASGHGRVVSDIAKLSGHQTIWFLDDATVPDMPVVGTVSQFVDYVKTCDFFVAIGNNPVRERIFHMLHTGGAQIVSLIHPQAVISDSVRIGRGVAVMAGAVVNHSAVLEDGVIVNTCSSVDHDCHIGAFTHISVGAHLAGTVTVGGNTFIGAGATVINNISMCADCTVGAGAVVVKNLTEAGTYVGVPAKKL